MKTWGSEKGPDKICTQCGSVYEVLYRQVPMKDIDSASCYVCGQELDRWKSTRYPSFTLKTRGEWPKHAPAD